MLDINLIRKNSEYVKKNLEIRGNPANLINLNELIHHDNEWRQLLTTLNNLRHRLKLTTKKIATFKKEKKDVGQELLYAKKLGEQIGFFEEKKREKEEQRRACLLRIPNLMDESVPKGNINVQLKKWGKIPTFTFPVKNHIDLGLKLDIIDLERAGKVAGARFFYLKGNGVILELALINFALRELLNKGYKAIEPPFLMRKKPYEGATALNDFQEDLYKIENEDLYLIATSEHPIAAMFMDEILTEEALPMRFVGISTNFRKEAGSHSKDTRGIFRTHQFNKVEQFAFCKPEESEKIHEELLKNSEDLIKKIGLPYRVMNICAEDIGTFASKKYDIEAWMPAQKAYGEIISCSNFRDYQARRLNIRYREKEGQTPKGFVHTLNATAIATGRTIVSILENYQQKDGSVTIPKGLRRHMNNIKKIAPPL